MIDFPRLSAGIVRQGSASYGPKMDLYRRIGGKCPGGDSRPFQAVLCEGEVLSCHRIWGSVGVSEHTWS